MPQRIRRSAGGARVDAILWPIADTGANQWGIAGSPAQSDDAVIVATIAGSLYAFPMQ
jgi:hypothetical protein